MNINNRVLVCTYGLPNTPNTAISRIEGILDKYRRVI